jgi:hypothetical protein
MTNGKRSFDEVDGASTKAFEGLFKSSAELNAALDYWDRNGRMLTQAALDRVESINTPEFSGLRKKTATELKNELARLPKQGEPLVPGHAGVIYSLLVWLEIVQMRVVEAMQAVVDIGPEKVYEQFYVVLRDACLKWMQDPQQAGNRAEFDEALEKAKGMLEVLKSPVDMYTELMAGATNPISEIADTFHEAAELLVAQLNLLVEFLEQTDPEPEQSEPSDVSGKTLFTIGIKETAIETAKEAASEGAKEFLKELGKEALKPLTMGAIIPVFAALSVAEKKKVIKEHNEELARQREKIRAEPSPENYMYALCVDLRKGNALIVEVIDEIGDFTNNLKATLVK